MTDSSTLSTKVDDPVLVSDPVVAEVDAGGPPYPLTAPPNDVGKAPEEKAHKHEPGAKWREKDVYDIPYK